jgi:hypothetical protein
MYANNRLGIVSYVLHKWTMLYNSLSLEQVTSNYSLLRSIEMFILYTKPANATILSD